MAQARSGSIEDVGIRVPKGMPLPIEPALLESVAAKSGELREEAARLAREQNAADPAGKLLFILGFVQQAMFLRSDRTVAEFARGPAKVECKKGCSFCCYQNVEATIPEAILVALRLGDAADPRRAAVEDAATALAGLGDEERIATGRPCPLLVDRQCSVYADRPLACRSVLSPDARRCQEALASLEAGAGIKPIELYPVLQFLSLGDEAAIRGLCKDLGLQHDVVELTQAVAAILREPSLVQRWAAGERVFTPR